MSKKFNKRKTKKLQKIKKLDDEGLFNEVVSEPWRHIAGDGAGANMDVFNDFINFYAKNTAEMKVRITENIENEDDYGHLPLLIINIFPKAQKKYAVGDGDCSIHSFLTCFSQNFRKLDKKTKIKFVEVCRTNIFPWMISKNKNLWPIVNPNASWTYEKTITDIRIPKKWLSDEDLNCLFHLFREAGFLYNPETSHKYGINPAKITMLNSEDIIIKPRNELHLIFGSGAHYMPVINGDTWLFNVKKLMCISEYISTDTFKRYKYHMLSNVVFSGKQYIVLDRRADSLDENIIEFVTKKLKIYAADKRKTDNKNDELNEELDDFCILRILGNISLPNKRYILLKKTVELNMALPNNIKNFSFKSNHFLEEGDPLKLDLPKKISEYTVDLVMVKEEDITNINAMKENATISCMKDVCTVFSEKMAEYEEEYYRLKNEGTLESHMNALRKVCDGNNNSNNGNYNNINYNNINYNNTNNNNTNNNNTNNNANNKSNNANNKSNNGKKSRNDNNNSRNSNRTKRLSKKTT